MSSNDDVHKVREFEHPGEGRKRAKATPKGRQVDPTAAHEIEQLLGRRTQPPTQQEVLDELGWVIDSAEDHLGAERAHRYLRKFYPWYFEGIGASKQVRDELQRSADLTRARELIEAARTPVGVA